MEAACESDEQKTFKKKGLLTFTAALDIGESSQIQGNELTLLPGPQ